MAKRQNSPGWATYLRVSDEDKQTPERSFAMQRKSIQDQLLSPSELHFKREYCDMLTGTNANRADYQQMLADAEVGKFSHLGLYRADRFGRNAVEGLQSATKLISLGIKIRVANMPSLTPEEPDGFFMFLIQMGLAQREVDVLKQRTADGMEAKMRAGGWPQKAPDGYLNKERQVSSNKYERWVEINPEFSPVIRQAWDMLLTGRYTLGQICNELDQLGYTRASGRPWAWKDPKTGHSMFAHNRLHKIFHNPFYAGWVVSKRFNIKMGEIRGQWEPIVTTQEYERGIAILHKHDIQKSRNKRHFYLLRNLLWVDVNGRCYKMYGSTPRGRTHSYSYYITHSKINGSKLHIPCKEIDEKIEELLAGITIEPELVPEIREAYRSEIKKSASEEREMRLAELNRQLSQLREEEARLGRLLITNMISEETYFQLRKEWQDKQRNITSNIADLERETNLCLDDLDAAIILMTKMSALYSRISENDRSKLLQIIIKQIIVNEEGEIINQELNSPFAYLQDLVDLYRKSDKYSRGSDQVRVGAPGTRELLLKTRSSSLNFLPITDIIILTNIYFLSYPLLSR